MRLLSLLLLAHPLFSQQTLGSIEGKVVNSLTGEPIKKAVVNLRSRTGQYTYNAVSDPYGKYHIDNVTPEKYIPEANAEGYSQSRFAETPKLFTVNAAQTLSGADIAIPPLSVITGKITDEDGEAMQGVRVTAMRYVSFNGARQLQSMNGGQTDDRGIFRLFDLQPGFYYLQAAPPNQALRNVPNSPTARVHSTVPEEGYASVFLPGVPLISQASPHELKPGEEWTGADFKLQKQPLYHIRGRIVADPLPGGMRPNVQAESGDCQQTNGLPGDAIASIGAQNTFDLRVVSRTYCLIVREASRGLAMRTTVTVKDANIDGLTLTPPQPISVKGTITIEGTPPSPLPAMGINLRSEGNNQSHSQVNSDLTFQFDNVFPGKHTIVMPGNSTLYIKSMTYGSTDVSNGVIPDVQPGAALSIVLASDPGQITGTVQPGSLESGAQVMIAAAPGGSLATRSDLYRVTLSWAEGTFTLPGVAPGDYTVLAIEGQNFEDIQNHELLKLLAGKGAAVTIHPGSHEQVTVTPVSQSDVRQAKERIQ